MLKFIKHFVQDLIGESEKPVDRICVVLRAGGEDHLLGAPGITSSTGLDQFMVLKRYSGEV